MESNRLLTTVIATAFLGLFCTALAAQRSAGNLDNRGNGGGGNGGAAGGG